MSAFPSRLGGRFGRCVLASILFSVAGAFAVPLRFEYSGVIRHISFFNGATDSYGYAVGNTVSGSFVFDADALDQDASNTRAFYPNSLASMAFGSTEATAGIDTYSSFNLLTQPPFISSYFNAIGGGVSDVYS